MMKYCYLVLVGISCLLTASSQNTRVAEGIVTDNPGNPLPQATVQALPAGPSVATNEKGRFILILPAAVRQIRVSFTGYQPVTVALDQVSDLTAIHIHLENRAEELDSVVVNTGYQTLPLSRSTGSAIVADKELLNKQVGPNILQRINGTVSGVLFDKGSFRPAFTIRGFSSINGPKDPLIVVDNFPYEGDINNINPNDIESITVLRDAAAAAIWGTRAGNGVLVITTKQAKTAQPLKVQLSANLTRITAPDAGYLPMMSSAGFIDLERFLFDKGFYNSDLSNNQRPPITPVVEWLDQHKRGLIDDAVLNQRLTEAAAVDVRQQLNQYWFQPSWRQQYHLMVQGGGKSHAFSLTAGADKNMDELAGDYQRFTLRGNHSLKLTKQLEWQVNAAVAITEKKAGRPSFLSLNPTGKNLYPYAQLADAVGNPLPLVNKYRTAYLDTAGAGKLLPWDYVPLEDYHFQDYRQHITENIINTTLQYQPLRGLMLEAIYQYQRQLQQVANVDGPNSYAARNLVNQFTMLNRSTGQLTYNLPVGGMLNSQENSVNAHNFRGQASYRGNNGDWGWQGLAGAEWRQLAGEQAQWRSYGYDPALRLSAPVDYINRYPHFITGANTSIPNADGYGSSLRRFFSWYGNAGLSWKQRYTLTGSVRKDASNLFGVASNEKGVPLWSAGGLWDVDREGFFRLSWLPELQLRSSYGFSGNADLNRSAVTTIQYTLPLSSSFQRAQISQVGNPELRWERVGTWNIGVSAKLLRPEIRFSVDYYRKKSVDLFGPVVIDYTAGLGSQTITRNVANMLGNGWDVTVQVLPLGKLFSWQAQLNYSISKNKVKDYFAASKQAGLFINGAQLVNPVEGRPIYAIYSYQFNGLDGQTGDPIGMLADKPSKDYTAILSSATQIDDAVYHGSATPVSFGNFLQTLSFKGITLDVNVTGRFGYYFRRKGLSYQSLYTTWDGHSDYSLRWQQPGDEARTHVPSRVYPFQSGRDAFYISSEALVEKGDHIRLQFVNLNYHFPRQQKVRFLSGADCFVNLANIGCIWRANGQGLDADISSGQLPDPLSIAAGFRLYW